MSNPDVLNGIEVEILTKIAERKVSPFPRYIDKDGNDWVDEDYIKLYLLEWKQAHPHTVLPSAETIARSVKAKYGIKKCKRSISYILAKLNPRNGCAVS